MRRKLRIKSIKPIENMQRHLYFWRYPALLSISGTFQHFTIALLQLYKVRLLVM